MKGLLLKDFYMLLKYCRAYLLIALVFFGVSLAEDGNNLFFAFYPCIFCGMIPVNLLAYDERSKWLQYSETMPYSKAQIVSGKYIIGLLVQLLVAIFTGIVQAVRLHINGGFSWKAWFVLMILLIIVSLFASSISLPFMFKLGVEKGRMAYYIMIGVTCATSVIASSVFSKTSQTNLQADAILAILLFGMIAIYALSWYLSIQFFKKREV